MCRAILLFGLILFMFGGATAGIIKVPENYATIQAGIDAAVKGDTVLVAAGTYYENINFKGKAITVASYFLVDGDMPHVNSIHHLATASVTMPADNSVVYDPAIVKMHEQWNLLPLTNPPTARYLHAQVYDAKRNVITVFGGWHYNPASYTYTMYYDTWQGDLNTSSWQQIETDIHPTERGGSHAVIDSSKGRIILFAGLAINGTTITTYNDLWEFSIDSLKWKQLTPVGAPPQNSGAPLVYDKVNNRVILFGGQQMDPPYLELNETWVLELDSLKWKKLNTIGTPPHARVGHSAVYDPKKHGLIILGGKYYDNGNIYLRDIWELNLETLEWKEIVPFSPLQDNRAGMATILDERNDRLIMFGGENDNSSLNDLWEFNLTLKKWKELSPAGSLPEKRSWITGNYDPTLNRMLVFGGNNSFSQMLNDTYELTLPEQSSIILVPEDQSSIQAGIDAAVNGDVVLVRDSTYFENINFLGKAITVASYFYVDGDTNHINNTVINGSQPTDPNKGSVVSFISGEDTTSVLCGFTITGGTGTLFDSNRRVGGGIYCGNSGARIAHNKIVNNSVTHNQLCLGGGIGTRSDQISKYIIIEDNLVESNSIYAQTGSSGGGIFMHMQSGSILNNKICNNFNSGGANGFSFGGGISTYDNVMGRYLIKIVGNSIVNNEATSTSASHGGIGGGIDIQYSDVLLLDNQISHNLVSGANTEGGAGIRLLGSAGSSMVKDNIISFNSGVMWGFGGGLEAVYTTGLTIQKNQFEGNEDAMGGGVSTYSTQGTVISGNTFLNNHSLIGGGIYEEQTDGSLISGNRLTGNSADYYGGGIMISVCSPSVYNNLIVNNKALFNGGGIYVVDQSSEPQIINNTIVADTAGVYGGGICSNSVSPVVMNTIIWGNFAPSGEQIYTIAGNTQVAYSDVQGGWPGEGNIDAEPQFVPGDTLYHLSSSSPCINVGNDSLLMGGIMVKCPPDDYEGDERPYMAIQPDIGADETQVLPVGIGPQPIAGIPKSYALQQNYPNPFNPTTTIEFALPASGFVTLKIYTILGEDVATLVSEKVMAGKYKYYWDAKGLASGVYFYKLEADNFILTRKMILIR